MYSYVDCRMIVHCVVSMADWSDWQEVEVPRSSLILEENLAYTVYHPPDYDSPLCSVDWQEVRVPPEQPHPGGDLGWGRVRQGGQRQGSQLSGQTRWFVESPVNTLFKGTVSRDFEKNFALKSRPGVPLNRRKLFLHRYSIAKFENRVSA